MGSKNKLPSLSACPCTRYGGVEYHGGTRVDETTHHICHIMQGGAETGAWSKLGAHCKLIQSVGN